MRDGWRTETRPAASSACDKIGDDVVGMLDADREAHVAGRDAGRELLLGVNC